MHFERNNWQFKPISKKMENSMNEVIHGTRGFAYRRPNKKKWNRHSKKCDCAHFQKGQTRRSGCMSVPFVNFLTECLCLFCDFNILFVCTWLQIFPPQPIFYDSIKLVTYHQNCIKKLGYTCIEAKTPKQNPTPPKIKLLPT